MALIAGRTLEATRRMAGLTEVVYAADHGLTVWVDGRLETAPGLEEYAALAREAEEDLPTVAEAFPGVQLENKGALLAVHYRRALERTRARAHLVSGAVGPPNYARRDCAAGLGGRQQGQLEHLLPSHPQLNAKPSRSHP